MPYGVMRTNIKSLKQENQKQSVREREKIAIPVKNFTNRSQQPLWKTENFRAGKKVKQNQNKQFISRIDFSLLCTFQPFSITLFSLSSKKGQHEKKKSVAFFRRRFCFHVSAVWCVVWKVTYLSGNNSHITHCTAFNMIYEAQSAHSHFNLNGARKKEREKEPTETEKKICSIKISLKVLLVWN